MTSKTDKVGEIFKSMLDSFLYALGSPTCITDLTKIQQQARHVLLEVIKAELPKKRDETDYAGTCSPCDRNPKNYENVAYNEALTEVTAILERLFKC